MRIILVIMFAAIGFCSFAQIARYEVLIDEIMCDPTPVARAGGLPESEFIELKNVSSRPVNLNGWKVCDASTSATINAAFILQPDSFVIISSTNAAVQLTKFGKVIGVSNFPSLDNDGDIILVHSKEGRLIHVVEYRISWYRNALKSEGGWTLEMTDTRNPCSGYSNWKASVNEVGGTPGRINSINGSNPDEYAPLVLRAFPTDSLNIVLVFDEPLDSISSVGQLNFFIDHNIGNPQFVEAYDPLFTRIKLRLDRPLERSEIYTVSVRNLSDCSGNRIASESVVKLGLPSYPSINDVVINEVLFNPAPNGVDFVEMYNPGPKIIDLKELYLGNRSATGTLGGLQKLSVESRLILPGDYVVISINSEIIKQQYFTRSRAQFIELNTMPSYPDDKGHVVLLNTQGLAIDELDYDEKWHFRLIVNNQGVSLERINYTKPTNDPFNWHSAATTAGYGTPGYQNSQFMQEKESESLISISPQVFSPDNDGFDDFATVNYHFARQGFVCNITIFDAGGRTVRYLARSAICGLKGIFRWDGLDDKFNRLSSGIYILHTEIFALDGTTKKFKNVIVLARK